MGGAYLVQTGKYMRQVQNRVTVLIDLMEHVVAEELDDVPVARL